MARSTVDHPFFARVWPVVATHEAEAVRALRRENLAGLSGRVLEVGAGIGTNFAFYPETVEQVVAMEPEPRLRPGPAQLPRAPVPVDVIGETVEEFSGGEQFDAVVCSLVLCSVRDPEGAAAPVFVAAARRAAALSRARGQRRCAGPVAAVRRRDGVAAVLG